MTRLLLGAYSAAQRSGLLTVPSIRRVYARAYFAYKRYLEDPFAGFLRRHPDALRGGSVVDVGAHIGYTASVFCAALDPGRRVYAFEPDPGNAELLTQNLAAEIAAGRVLPLPLAVGAASGPAELLRCATHPGDHRVVAPGAASGVVRPRLAVSRVSLDDFFARREPEPIAFVKVDVQGSEIEVCRGMAALLDRDRVPWVAIEHAPDESRALGFEPDLAPAFLRERGYELRLLRHSGATESWPTPGSDALLARRGYVDLLAGR